MVWEKIGLLLPGIAAVGLAACVGVSLLGYESPAYGKDSSTADTATGSITSTETAAAVKGNFELDDGVYRGTGVGYSGNTVVDVTIADKTITGIDIVSEEDSDDFFNMAKDGIIKEILEQQSYDVDAVTGATYSSRGIKNAVKNAITGEVDTSERGDASASAEGSSSGATVSSISEGTFEDGTYTGSAQGYSGTTTVRVTVKDHKITSIEVLSYGDSDEYFNKARSVINAMISGNTTNVDAVSGATFSSRGIINAVRNALGQSTSGSSGGSGASSGTSGGSSGSSGSASISSVQEPSSYKDGTYTGEASGNSGGFNGGTTRVSVTISGGKITAINLLSNQDTAEYFNKAKSLVNTIIARQSTNVDAVSGASFSSRGIINAVRNALAKAAGSGTSGGDDNAAKDSTQSNNNKENSKSTTNNNTTPITGTYKDGTYEAQATCSDGDQFNYKINVSLTVKDNKITAVSAQASGIDNTSKSFFNQANASVPGRIVSKQSTSVDTVSGATYSSNAIMKGAADALAKAKTVQEVEQVDRTALASIINHAAALKESDYTPLSWQTFVQSHALTNAQAVFKVAGASQSDINTQTSTLSKAVEALVQRADKTGLANAISDADKQMAEFSADDYTQESWQNLTAALSDARTADENENISQEAADSAASNLRTALSGLVKAQEPVYTYWATVRCTDGEDGDFDYNIKTTLTIQGGKIIKCEAESDDIDDSSKTYFGYAVNGRTRKGTTYSSVLQNIVDKQSADNIDTVSGATYSSDAIIEGARQALELAEKEQNN